MAVTPRHVKNKRDHEGKLTGRAGTVYDVNVKYKDVYGKSRAYVKKGILTKQEATQHEAEMRVKLRNPDYIEMMKEKTNQTVQEYMEDWISTHGRNLRDSTVTNYKANIKRYINPNIGNVKLSQLSPPMLDKLFNELLDRGLAPGTVLCVKRLLSVSLEHARKYRYVDTNAAKDTLTKLATTESHTDMPYTIEQTKTLLNSVINTIWIMPVVLGGTYGLRRSEVAGLMWPKVDLENDRFTVNEQLPFKLPAHTKKIVKLSPTKSKASERVLPITSFVKPFFVMQKQIQELQKQYALENNLPYYDNELVVAKPDGSPVLADWISTTFPDLLEALDLPHLRFHDLRHTAATNMYNLTGDFFTVGEILGHTGIGAALGVSVNPENVTARYVEVRLERKKEVLDSYHQELNKKIGDKLKPVEGKKIPTPRAKKYRGYEL